MLENHAFRHVAAGNTARIPQDRTIININDRQGMKLRYIFTELRRSVTLLMFALFPSLVS